MVTEGGGWREGENGMRNFITLETDTEKGKEKIKLKIGLKNEKLSSFFDNDYGRREMEVRRTRNKRSNGYGCNT